MRFFKADLRRAVREPGFLLALALALACGLGPYFAAPGRMAAADRWLSGHDGLLPWVYPVLAALPYSLTSLRERESGMDKNIRLALGAGSYRMPRLAVVMFTGAAVVTAPVLLLSLLTGHFPRELVLAPLCGAAFSGLSAALAAFNRRGYIPLLGPWVVCMLLTYAAPYLDSPALWPPLWWSPAIQPGWGSFTLACGVPAGMIALAVLITALTREEDRL